MSDFAAPTHESDDAIMSRIARILFCVTIALEVQIFAAPTFTVQPVANVGFDVFADGVLAAPIRLDANGAILADTVVTNSNSITLSGLHTSDPLAVTFAADDYVSITLSSSSNAPEPIVQFKLTLLNFNTNRWLALFPGGAAPFHFLICSMPTAQG